MRQLKFVSLQVSVLKASTEFYTQKLEFELSEMKKPQATIFKFNKVEASFAIRTLIGDINIIIKNSGTEYQYGLPLTKNREFESLFTTQWCGYFRQDYANTFWKCFARKRFGRLQAHFFGTSK